MLLQYYSSHDNIYISTGRLIRDFQRLPVQARTSNGDLRTQRYSKLTSLFIFKFFIDLFYQIISHENSFMNFVLRHETHCVIR